MKISCTEDMYIQIYIYISWKKLVFWKQKAVHSLGFRQLFLNLIMGFLLEQKDCFGGDTIPTARQISKIQGCNSRALHCSGFCPGNSNFLLCVVHGSRFIH